MDREVIRIKYHSREIEKLKYIDGKSDWIDLRVSEDLVLKKGDFALIKMGISVQLPKGYEMIIAARSSTFKNFGLIQTNAIGVVAVPDIQASARNRIRRDREPGKCGSGRLWLHREKLREPQVWDHCSNSNRIFAGVDPSRGNLLLKLKGLFK